MAEAPLCQQELDAEAANRLARFEAFVCWARRWYLNAPWIRAEAWRTLRVWARWSGDSRPAGRAFGWAPLVDVDTTARLARLVETPTPTLRRPRDGGGLIWLVRHRVWPTPASLEDLANGVTERGLGRLPDRRARAAPAAPPDRRSR